MANGKKKLTSGQYDDILKILQARFEKNMDRHPELVWSNIQERLESNPDKLWSLYEMEKTAGEPDIIEYDEKDNVYIFYDCSKESPKGRRSVCYDQEALEARKQHKPQNSAINMANEMGINILTEEQYRKLQTVGNFDLKSSSWVETPENIRKLGGAIFCDRRYDTVFMYHNGADSYYAARGFRGYLKV